MMLIFERYWAELLDSEISVHLIGVFADGDGGTYSPF